MDDLNAFCDEISADIEGRGIDLLPALVVPGAGQATVLWSDDADWAGFVTAAQKLGARQILLGRQFAENAGQRLIAQVNISWIHDSTVYVLTRRADWYADEEVEPVASRAPGELRERDVNTLVAQMLAFVEGHAVDADSLSEQKQLFWESKGVQAGTSSDLETQHLMRRVDAVVEAQAFEKEKVRLPELVAACAGWARGQDLRRVTKTNIEDFLRDRDIPLSRTGRNELYAQTNVAMARYSN